MPLVAGLELSLPVVGANMDTVMGPEMAKTLALEGGLGFLHRSCPIEAQAELARYVKTRHSYVIEHPIVLERPIVVDRDSGKAVLGRPPESVQELLS